MSDKNHEHHDKCDEHTDCEKINWDEMQPVLVETVAKEIIDKILSIYIALDDLDLNKSEKHTLIVNSLINVVGHTTRKIAPNDKELSNWLKNLVIEGLEVWGTSKQHDKVNREFVRNGE